MKKVCGLAPLACMASVMSRQVDTAASLAPGSASAGGVTLTWPMLWTATSTLRFASSFRYAAMAPR